MLSWSADAQPGGLDPSFNAGNIADARVNAVVIQPDGRIIIAGQLSVGAPRIARLNADGTPDINFIPGTGANGEILAVALQNDGKILIGGTFTLYNGTPRNRIARLNDDGTLDGSFNPTGGADQPVQAIAIAADGKIVIGGAFGLVNGTPRNRIARLTTTGAQDGGFNPGTGANGTVFSLAIQTDSLILAGGDFNAYNGTSIGHLVRINTNGTRDLGFNTLGGPDTTVRTIAIEPDGQILIGGNFLAYGITARARIARINGDGSLDGGFNPGLGASGAVWSVLPMPGGRIAISGNFTNYNGTPRNRIAQLNDDGSLYFPFNPGLGADNLVAYAKVEASGKLIIAGDFTNYNNTPVVRVASLLTDTTLGAALYFDGVNDAILGPAELIPTGNSPYTVSVWAKTPSVLTQYSHIVSQGREFYIGYNPSGNIRAGDSWIDIGVAFPTDGEWHNYTLVRTTDNTYFYSKSWSVRRQSCCCFPCRYTMARPDIRTLARSHR